MSIKANEKILAKACISIIIKHLGSSQEGRQNFRLKNLQPSVYESLLKQWEHFQAAGEAQDITVLVAYDSPIECEDKYRAEKNKTITDARNDLNIKKLVYLETKDESDGQSHKSFFTLRDIDLLKGTLDIHGVLDSKATLTSHALDEVTKHPAKNHLSKLCQRVVEALLEEGVSISALKYASFVYWCGIELEKFDSAVEEKSLLKIIGNNLIYLDLFNDESWFFNENIASKRLYFNSLCAELAKSESQDLDVHKEIESLKYLTFRDEDNNPYEEVEQKFWRKLCTQYLEERRFETRKEIPFRIFEQLFKKTMPGLQLGQQVLQEVMQTAPSRVEELNELYVIDGLDKKLQEAAESFLEADPESDELPTLKTILTPKTRKKIEALAKPKAKRFDNPFIQLSEAMDGFTFEPKTVLSEYSIKLTLDKKTESENNPTLGLFNFLFAESLRYLAYITSNSDGVTFIPDEKLLVQYDFPLLNDLKEDAESELLWLPLRFEIELQKNKSESNGNSEDIQVIDTEGPVEWLPDIGELIHLSFLWNLIKGVADLYNKKIKLNLGHDFESSFISLMSGETELSEHLDLELLTQAQPKAELDKAIEAKKELLNSLTNHGLSIEALETYVDQLHQCYVSASQNYIPNNQVEQIPAALISMDIIYDASGKASLMMPYHPLKARWLSRYIRETIKLSEKAFTGNLSLNSENSDLYFDWVNSLSPAQMPAITTNLASDLLISTKVNGWFEYFTTADSLISVESGTPKIILDEIVKKVHQYLHHHPHKTDGLSITVVTRDDAGIAANLVSRIRVADFSSTRMTVNLIADTKIWSKAISEFESVDSENRFTMDGALFPEVELRLFNLNPDDFASGHDLKELESDVLVIPHFLEEKNLYQERNKNISSELSGESKFDPLHENPIYIEPTTGDAISVALLPDRADELSESWSTMVTRQRRLSPVSNMAYSTHGGTDYIVKQIKFSDNERLLELSHEVAHWVITIEQYLNREQIENLPNKPDIISFKSGVGPGGKYSLMVSSSKGKKFIIERLEKKLSKIILDDELGSRNLSQISALIYDDTRHLSPELALDALGVARVTEEILGLAVARRTLESAHQLDVENGLSVLVSLDNYKNWFAGGDSAVRADILKLVFELEDDSLNVYAYVVESKLRKEVSTDGHGEQQVLSTIKLLEQFLEPKNAALNIDSKLWRNNIISAILNTSDKAFTYYGNNSTKSVKIDYLIRDKFLNGDFNLRLIHGLFIQSSTSYQGEITVVKSIQDPRVDTVKVGRKGIVEALTVDDGLKSIKGLLEIQLLDSITHDTTESVQQDQTPETTNDKAEPQNDTSRTSQNDDLIEGYDGQQASLVEEQVGLSVDELKSKYQEIISILSHKHGLNIKALSWDKHPVVEGPSSFLYRFEYHGNNPNEIAQKHDSLKLDLRLQENQSLKYGIDSGYVTIDVPKQEHERYFVEATRLWSKFSKRDFELRIPLGIDRFGMSVEINFTDSNSPHLLIGGTTGSGKSEALNTILTGLCKFYNDKELNLLLVDPKGNELTLYEDLDIVPQPIAVYEDEAMALLSQAVEEMNARYSVFRETSKSLKTRIADLAKFNELASSDDKMPWWLIVIDEYADLTSNRDFKKDFEKQVMRIAQKGRAAGVHLVIATQKPSGDVISTTLRSNLPAALALRVRDYHASRVILEENGAEALIGKGDGILKRQGSIERIQCAWVEDIPGNIGLN